MKILVVDKNPANFYILESFLLAHGHNVEIALNGAEALNKVETVSPDLIISETLMPEMDGFQLCYTIKRNEKLKNIPLVFYTATYTDPEDETFAKSIGADKFLIKPQNSQYLISVLNEVVQADKTSFNLMDDASFLKEHNKLLLKKLDVVNENLKASEKKYNNLTEHTNDLIYVLSLNGKFISVNKTTETITGYTRNELLGMNFTQLVSMEHLPIIKKMISYKFSGNTQKLCEIEILSKEHNKVSLQINTLPVYLDNDLIGLQCIARDVTKAKLLEAEIRQSRKMEVVGRLAVGIVHDFNNLLTAILGQTYLLLMYMKQSEPLRNKVEEIRKAGERAAALTSQLLAFSRKHINQPKLINLNTIVTDLNRMLRRLLGEDINLQVRLQPDLHQVKADPHQIEQVVINLGINARDAMSAGGELIIGTDNVNLANPVESGYEIIPAGQYVVLTVSNAGSGINSEIQEKIFNPFFTTKDSKRGNGPCLSAVYSIIKEIGGYARVKNSVEHGTVFELYLPESTTGADASTLKTTSEKAVSAKEEVILLVEDEEILRGLTHEILAGLGYNVLEAATSEDALSICNNHEGPIHLMITDVVMPKMSGMILADLAKKIRPEMHVLYMSGYTGDIVIGQGVNDDANAFLQKPFSPEELANKIHEMLDKPRQYSKATGNG
jgi:two-component system, cell cycle sensor histidine kinase and response regulator CckA